MLHTIADCRWRPSTSPAHVHRRKQQARFNYLIEERFEAGIVLDGWEVKAIRAGQVQLTDGYVVIRDGELFLIGCRINPLRTASTHVHPEADRTKKLLMHKDEIRRLIGKVEQKGYTLVPLNLHYKGGRVKAEIALAKGKHLHDKRETEKKRDWEREKGRLMRHKVSSGQGLTYPRLPADRQSRIRGPAAQRAAAPVPDRPSGLPTASSPIAKPHQRAAMRRCRARIEPALVRHREAHRPAP